jgi:hypothetical protein
MDGDGLLLLAAVALALFAAWLMVPPSVMVEALVGRRVDPLWPNLAACLVLLGLGVLAGGSS